MSSALGQTTTDTVDQSGGPCLEGGDEEEGRGEHGKRQRLADDEVSVGGGGSGEGMRGGT